MFEAASNEIEQTQAVEIERLLDNPYQPRLTVNPEALEELVSVIQSQGFLGALVARPHPERVGYFQLAAGHRRREASRKANLKRIPVVIKELLDEEMVAIAITENIQREDLTPLEEGRIFAVMSEKLGFTHEQIARAIGKARGYVENRLRLTRAPEDVQALAQAKPDSLRAVSTLVKIEDEGQRSDLIEGLLHGKLTADDITAIRRESSPPRRLREKREPLQPNIKELQTAVRGLHQYTEKLAQRETIGAEEREALQELFKLVESLRAHFENGK
jgi:ParB family chromosome partitioning protein